MNAKPRYWFPAKTYGWGWGIPCAWQGWAVLVVYFGIVATGSFLFKDRPGPLSAAIAGASLLLVGICWLKGEPPRWRWGRKGEMED
jgi:hypothetical protein